MQPRAFADASFLTALTLPGQLVATAFSFAGVCFS